MDWWLKHATFTPPQFILFGKSPNPDIKYANLLTNNLATFDDLDQAETARLALIQRNQKAYEFSGLGIARLRLQIALTEAEIHQFAGRKDLITIMEGDQFCELFGRRTKGSETSGYLPGDFLTHNGFKPFPSYEDAIHSMEEIIRQGQSPAKLATFSLKNADL